VALDRARDPMDRLVILGRRVHDLEVERRILGEHGLVQALQLPARLDAELVDQNRASGPVGLERLGLPT
jgi:hypothetical protein